MFGSGQQKALARLRIDREVFVNLAVLAAERGGPTEARKRTRKGLKELNPKERVWLDAAVKAVILSSAPLWTVYRVDPRFPPILRSAMTTPPRHCGNGCCAGGPAPRL